MDSSSAHGENYWQPLPHCLLCCSSATLRTPCEATHNNNTPHRSAPAHTPTYRSKKLASTPPELAGAQQAAPAAPHGPTAGNPAWATAPRRGCPSRPAARRGPRSRGAVPSIGLAAGARIVQAPGLPPAPAPGACRAALQSGRGHDPHFLAAAPSHALPFNRARAHIP